MSKPFYSENNLYTNKEKKNQYRFSHGELFYTSLQTYFKTLSTFALGLLKSPSNITAPSGLLFLLPRPLFFSLFFFSLSF